jgi:hypothetical protein
MPRSELTSAGLKRDLRRKGYKKPENAISEYIWNGFDAGASVIELKANYNLLGVVTAISIQDNGKGIENPENFRPVFESRKALNPEIVRLSSNQHGINGLGRLTFFTFAGSATWQTVSKTYEGRHYYYEIRIDSSDLLNWHSSDPAETNQSTGTKVIFTEINEAFGDITDENIITHLKSEFGWYLELNKGRGHKINVNDQLLDYSDTIVKSIGPDRVVLDSIDFELRFVLWKSKQNSEYSKYYLIGSDNIERRNRTTTLNNKGDGFFHSLYITSSFFNDLEVISFDNVEELSGSIFRDTKEAKVYGKLIKYIEKYLHDQRKPFIAQASEEVVDDFEKKGIIPQYREDDEWEAFQKRNIRLLVKQLYVVQPKIFNSLSTDQKKIFVRFLDVINSSSEREKILNILKEVISLDSTELEQLEKTLRASKLSNIVKTIQLIEDRCKVVDSLRKLVFNKKKFNANEPDHVQRIVESNYWIFGEKYHLVSAEEPDFEQALRGYVHILREGEGEVLEELEKTDYSIDHPSKKKQMDVFLCRQNKKEDSIDHIVVELKNPKVKLGKKEFDQVKEYMEVILSKDIFNAQNSNWEFYLIGNSFSPSKYIEREQENVKMHGEKSLAFKFGNYKIFVKTWSEVFNEFEIRHGFLQDKLKIERHKLMEEEAKLGLLETADSITENAANLSSSMPEPIVQSKKQREISAKKQGKANG